MGSRCSIEVPCTPTAKVARETSFTPRQAGGDAFALARLAGAAKGEAPESAAARTAAAVCRASLAAPLGGNVGGGGRDLALALEGGGFLAFTVQAGILSGLLAAHRQATMEPLDVSGLLRRVGIVSSVSGGSWFMCELAYSSKFHDLVERMGANPSAAGALFDKEWVEAWLSIGNRLNPLVKIVALAADALSGGEALGQNIREIAHFVDTGLNWRNFTATLLRVTAGIEADRQLGSDVEAWAKGKVWILGSSLVLPTGQNGAEKVTVFSSSASNVAGYAAKVPSSGSQPPLFVPARSSVILGAGPTSDAPLSYVAETAVPPTTTLGFSGAVEGDAGFFGSWCGCGGPVEVAVGGGGGGAVDSFSNFEVGAGAFPLADVVGASSAFLGGLHLEWPKKDSGLFAQISELLGADMSMWISTAAADGQGFARAHALVDELFRTRRVTRAQFDGLAAAGLLSVIDGCFTDCTGVAHAVAGGATEVIVLLDHTSSGAPVSLLRLFGGGGSEEFRIFAEDAEEIRARCDSADCFRRLALPPGSQVLLGIATGSLAATTLACRSFGVAAGRPVALHVVSVTATLNLGELENFHDYGVLLQEIVAALTSEQNEAVVLGELLPRLLGPPPPPPPAAAA